MSGENNATTIVKSILSHIHQGNNEEAINLLSQLPIAIISKDQAELILSLLLKQACVSKNTQVVREIIHKFHMERLQSDPLPAITNIFLNPLLEKDILIFTASCFPEMTTRDFFADLVNMGDDVSALKAASEIVSTLEPPSNDDWIALVRMTDNFEEEEYENRMLREFFQAKAVETGKCSSCPEWIIESEDNIDIPAVPMDFPSTKDALDLILENFDKQQISISSKDEDSTDVDDKIRNLLISQYSIATMTEKVNMLSDIKSIPKFDDTPIFREFGPVNSMYSISTSNDDPEHDCVKYGGCRMLLCTEFEAMHDDTGDIDIMTYDDFSDLDWFRGSCDACMKNISKRHYSVRLPLKHGGWQGCYCSFDCMKEYVEDPNTALVVGKMQEQLKTIGIRDR